MRTTPDPLLTDLYQLTMLQSYVEQGMGAPAVFEFFVRELPAQRNFMVAAGAEQLLDYLETLRFDAASLDWLRASGRFQNAFIDWLADFRFTGEVWAMPEGTICFSDEPLVQIVAPLPQAQFIESRLINLIHYQTLIASKAARCTLAAPASALIDFGLRRAHGDEAGHLAARACFLAGFAGTATVSAGEQFGIPLYGTMAHAYVQAVGNELEAFRTFAKSHPDNVVLLVDTYDVARGVANAITVGRELVAAGAQLHGIRIDSGELGAAARRARVELDAAGLASVKIICSGGLDEMQLQQLVAEGAPIDGYGVGTTIVTSADAAYLECAYKLQSYDGRATRKRSAGKATMPGRKQVYRQFDGEGRMCGDTVTLFDRPVAGDALLQPMMKKGKRLEPGESIDVARDRVREGLQQLPEAVRSLGQRAIYPVTVAESVQQLCNEVDGDLPAIDNNEG